MLSITYIILFNPYNFLNPIFQPSEKWVSEKWSNYPRRGQISHLDSVGRNLKLILLPLSGCSPAISEKIISPSYYSTQELLLPLPPPPAARFTWLPLTLNEKPTDDDDDCSPRAAPTMAPRNHRKNDQRRRQGWWIPRGRPTGMRLHSVRNMGLNESLKKIRGNEETRIKGNLYFFMTLKIIFNTS